jgi:aspartate/methionine/tyrosine aminotransferase
VVPEEKSPDFLSAGLTCGLSERESSRSTGEIGENLVKDENRVYNLGWNAIFYPQKMQQNFLISANSFVQRAGIVALSKAGDEAVERMRAVYDKRRKLMVELMRAVGFGIPVMPQGAFYVFADASRFIPPDGDSLRFAFELLEKAGVGVAPGVDFGQAGRRAVRFSYASSEENIREAARRLGEYLGGR